jgi:hypothetical protein
MIKAIFGYDIAPRVDAGDHDRGLWEPSAPDRLANPHIAGLVVNSVRAVIRGNQRYDRVAELHFSDSDAFERYRQWDAARTGAPARGTAAHDATACDATAREETACGAASRVRLAFGVLAEAVDVDRNRMNDLIADPRARMSSPYPQPGVKAMLGYEIVSGVTRETYDQWLWNIHVPDLLENPHLQRIVFNTVLRSLVGGPSFFRIAELHFADPDAHARFDQWRARNPVPVERGPAGRTDFRFYVLATVHSLALPANVQARPETRKASATATPVALPTAPRA